MATIRRVGPADVMTFPGTFGAGDAGVNLSQAFLDVTWAKQFNDRFSFGVSAVLVAQYFEAKGVMSFAGYTETFAASGSKPKRAERQAQALLAGLYGYLLSATLQRDPRVFRRGLKILKKSISD